MTDSRWQQRFQNLSKAFQELDEAVHTPMDSKLAKAGLIQTFEFTFELAWKTLKDYCETEGFDVPSPRVAIKQAFQSGYIHDAAPWLDALEKRNLLAHTYNETNANKAVDLIITVYFPMIKDMVTAFNALI